MKFYWQNSALKFFWLIISGLLCGFCFLFIGDRLNFLPDLIKNDFSTVIPICFFGLLFYTFPLLLLLRLDINLKKQLIHKEFSWVEIYIYCISTAPFYSLLIGSILNIENLGYHLEFISFGDLPIWLNIIIYLLPCSFYLWYLFAPKIKVEPKYKFAFGSVGLDGDKFGFKNSIGNVADSFMKANRTILVAVLFGDAGSGKSSYTRMLIESFSPKDILYTYISLTETNEASDFSKLFASRWKKTLEERYPSLNGKFNWGIVKEITREFDRGVISQLLLIIEKGTFGLLKTVSWNNKYEVISNEAASVFNNIPNINEKLWVIVIDEIDRAKLGEVYRVIEMLERFKQLSNEGFPIRLLFFLNVSKKDIGEFLKKDSEKNWESKVVYNFLFNTKSFDRMLFLPPYDFDLLIIYIRDLTKESTYFQMNNKYNSKESRINLNNLTPSALFRADSTSLTHERILEYDISRLLEEVPRVIDKTFDQELFNSLAYLSKLRKESKANIRYGEILLFAYAQVKYPDLIEFIRKTIYIIEPKANGVDRWVLQDKFKQGKKTLLEWMSEVLDHPIKYKNSDEIENILGILSREHMQIIRGVDRGTEKTNPAEIYESLSYPPNMVNYLNLLNEENDEYKLAYELYREHESQLDSGFLDKVDRRRIGYYAGFARSVYGINPKVNLEIARRVYGFYSNKEIIPQNYNTGFSSEYSTMIYDFIFPILEVLESRDKSLHSIAFDYLISFLKDKNIGIEVKFMILSAFLKREGNSMTDIRFSEVVDKLEEDKRKVLYSVAQTVFDSVDRKYINGRAVIYNHEENFFYVMYQNWSGKSNNTQEIEKIRRLALRGLSKNIDAFKKYFDQLPYTLDVKNIDDIREFDLPKNSLELYMPLKNLMKVAKKLKNEFHDDYTLKKIDFWTRVLNDSVQYKKYLEYANIRDDPNVMRAILTTKGIIKKR